MKARFYRCSVCGNVVVKLVDSNLTPACCGRPMEELAAHTLADEAPVDAPVGKTEYHVPQVTALGHGAYRISVGSEPHPMTRDHHIAFVAATTRTGGSVAMLCSSCPAEATLVLAEPPVAFYAYCNIHGLWRASAPANDCDSDERCASASCCPTT